MIGSNPRSSAPPHSIYCALPTSTASRLILDAASDENPLVRVTAASRLAALPPDARFDALAPLLTDPVRAVRAEAARALASVPASRFDTAQRGAFVTALDEYRDAQLAINDVMPGAHLNLAVLHMN